MNYTFKISLLKFVFFEEFEGLMYIFFKSKYSENPKLLEKKIRKVIY